METKARRLPSCRPRRRRGDWALQSPVLVLVLMEKQAKPLGVMLLALEQLQAMALQALVRQRDLELELELLVALHLVQVLGPVWPQVLALVQASLQVLLPALPQVLAMAHQEPTGQELQVKMCLDNPTA